MEATNDTPQPASFEEQLTTRAKRRRKISLLVAAHGLAMLALGMLRPAWPTDLSSTLEFAQVTLLGIWFALGAGTWRRRLLKSFCCLVVVVMIKERPMRIFFMATNSDLFDLFIEIALFQAILMATAWLTAAGGVAAVKRWGPKLKLIRLSELDRQPSRFQFSIRSLLLAILVTAVILSVAMFVRAHFDPNPAGMWIIFCFLVPIFAVYSAAVAVASVWAGLGTSHLSLRTAATVSLQLGLALVISFAFSQTWHMEPVLWQTAQQFAETVVIIGSLLVVRSCGYRIVAQAVKPAPMESHANGAVSAHPLD